MSFAVPDPVETYTVHFGSEPGSVEIASRAPSHPYGYDAFVRYDWSRGSPTGDGSLVASVFSDFFEQHIIEARSDGVTRTKVVTELPAELTLDPSTLARTELLGKKDPSASNPTQVFPVEWRYPEAGSGTCRHSHRHVDVRSGGRVENSIVRTSLTSPGTRQPRPSEHPVLTFASIVLARAFFGAVFVLAPRIALAEAGEWAEGSVGIERHTGTLTFTNRGHTLEDGVSGTGLALGGRIGYAASKYWGLGLGANVIVSYLDPNGLSGAHLDLGLFTGVALEGRLRPMGNGFFLGASIGYARWGFAGGKDAFGSPDNVYEFEATSGPEVALAVGWSKGLFGPAVRIGYQHLSSEHSRYRPIVVSLSLVIEHWSAE